MRLQRARDAGITVLFVLDPFGSVRPTTPTHEEEPEAVTRVAERVDGQEMAWRDAA